MRIFEDRQHERRIGAIRRRVVAVRPFHPPPSVVFATHAARRLQINLFPRILSNVADPEIPVSRSKLNRHGLRRPYAQISPRAPLALTNGFVGGTTYGVMLMSIRRILPRSTE